MDVDQMPGNRNPDAMLPWIPLIVAALCSYGGVAFNYGFALYFLDYRHGFVKRGLLGELFSPLNYITGSYLLALEYFFLAVAFGLTYVVFRRSLFGTPSERRLFAVLLSAPAVLPHLGYLFSQPDVILYILVLGCLAVMIHASPNFAVFVSCLLCCFALLFHEAFCLMFYPLVVAILLHLCARRRLPWIAGWAHVLAVSAVFAAVTHWGTLKISPDALLVEAQARTNVGVQRQVFDVMASTLAQQRALVHRLYTVYVIRALYLTLLLSIPYFVLLARLLYGAMRDAKCGAMQKLLTTLLFLSPLSLCALGHDTTRWMGAMCIDATFFILYLYVSEFPDSPVRRHLWDWADGPSFVPWFIYLVAIGPYGATGLRSAEQLVNAWFGS
jgi:hypothetical protein